MDLSFHHRGSHNSSIFTFPLITLYWSLFWGYLLSRRQWWARTQLNANLFLPLKLKASKPPWITGISLQIFQIKSSWKLIPSFPYHSNSQLNNWENSKKGKSQVTELDKSPSLQGNSIAASIRLLLKASVFRLVKWLGFFGITYHVHKETKFHDNKK